ncbi:CHAP domain-containing protein [Nonomuraea sp. NPDC050153]|uniref:CHAP domain-containing protein n=1 Tax=Nonomuraea sp. NPDC050153 TaxID=3364359 RepID=UPI00378BE102
MTAESMLAAARRSLGLSGRPNYITQDYARRHGAEFLSAPWCAMAVTYWARESGNAAAVLPDGDRAYTVWFAEDGKDLGRWYPGTATAIREHAEPGAIVFFDWDGTNTISKIDHVGVIEKNLGDGRVQTIEGNTGDACKRRVRAAAVIAGFWNPPYKTSVPTSTTEQIVKDLPLLGLGFDNWDVKTVRGCLNARGYVPPAAYAAVEGGMEGWLKSTMFDVELVELVRVFQLAKGLDDDGWVGPLTWRALLRVS